MGCGSEFGRRAESGLEQGADGGDDEDGAAGGAADAHHGHECGRLGERDSEQSRRWGCEMSVQASPLFRAGCSFNESFEKCGGGPPPT